jgi:hypothetical protein
MHDVGTASCVEGAIINEEAPSLYPPPMPPGMESQCHLLESTRRLHQKLLVFNFPEGNERGSQASMCTSLNAFRIRIRGIGFIIEPCN